MGFCKGLGKNYLIALNTVVACCGLAVAGCFTYAKVSYDDFSALFSESGVLAGIACGALVVICGFIGCCGAMKQNKCLLTIYSLGMMLLILAELAMGALIILYLGYMDDVDLKEIGKIDHEMTRVINNYELAAWQKCCYDNDEYNAESMGWAEVMECFEDTPTGACYYEDDGTKLAWDDYLNWATQEVCSALSEIELNNGDKLVGSPADSHSCGGVTPDAKEKFQTSINTWFNDHAMPLGIGACVVTVIQLFALIFSCCLLCENREEYDEEYARKLQEQEMAAGNLSGTAPAGYSKPSEYV